MNQNFNEKICIVFPGMLEAQTERGGGREERILHIASHLEKFFNITIIAPYFYNVHRIDLTDHLHIKNIRFPAVRNYPLVSNIEKFASFFSLFFSLFLLVFI